MFNFNIFYNETAKIVYFSKKHDIFFQEKSVMQTVMHFDKKWQLQNRKTRITSIFDSYWCGPSRRTISQKNSRLWEFFVIFLLI